MAQWLINPSHSVAEFAVRHMMVSWVHGHFNHLRGTLSFDPMDVAASSVEAEIDGGIIHTGVEMRDNHLRSPDFLDVENHPAIAFKSNRVELAGLDHAWVYGDLTIRGVVRSVMLDVRWAGPVRFDDEGKIYTTYGFRAETKINREDFGMVWNTEMELGGFVVGKHVYLTLDLEVDLLED